MKVEVHPWASVNISFPQNLSSAQLRLMGWFLRLGLYELTWFCLSSNEAVSTEQKERRQLEASLKGDEELASLGTK